MPMSPPRCECPAKQREFDCAFIRLQERYERLSNAQLEALTEEQLDALALLEHDGIELRRHDHQVLIEHALRRGVDLGQDAYKKSAPVIYMARLLASLGLTDLEDVFRTYPELRTERRYG